MDYSNSVVGTRMTGTRGSPSARSSPVPPRLGVPGRGSANPSTVLSHSVVGDQSSIPETKILVSHEDSFSQPGAQSFDATAVRTDNTNTTSIV